MRTLHWNSLSTEERREVLERPAQRDATRTASDVRAIVEAVRRDGDAALRELTLRFDGAEMESLAVSALEFADAGRALDAAQHAAIDTAIGTVHKFHAAQLPAPLRVETARTGT
jgi:histidinol dehydrogenase